MLVLTPEQWQPRQEAHQRRVRPWVAPRLARRSRGEQHPVDDFLFEYYPYRPGALLTWHPGAGVALRDAPEHAARRGYRTRPDGTTTFDVDSLRPRLDGLRWTIELLERTATREPRLGCFGLHEWAMVYRLAPSDVRHPTWPLRLEPAQIDAVVQAQPLRCTHFDAFRFFTAPARPLNESQPTRAAQAAAEQPGCLHATMDLYRWTASFQAAVGSELTADSFALAREVREVDMRAAPYDLRALGYEPIEVETAAGRAEFVAAQRSFAERGAVLRERVATALRAVLTAATEPA